MNKGVLKNECDDMKRIEHHVESTRCRGYLDALTKILRTLVQATLRHKTPIQFVDLVERPWALSTQNVRIRQEVNGCQ